MTTRPLTPGPGRTRLVARLAATALVASVAVVALPSPASAATLPITDGHLDWGVKESFRNYVTGPIGKGEIKVSNGATATDDGFRFSGGTGEYDTDTHNVTTAFDGTVQFLAHKSGDTWALDLVITDLRLNTTGQTGTIVADMTSKDQGSGEYVEYDDVDLADLDLTGISPETGDDGFTTLADIPATLTADGAEAFGGFYSEGTELDAATVSVKAGAGGNPSEPADGSIADGYLDWGVKKSFRDYIVGPIAKGKIDLADGATETGSGYQFPDATGEFDDAADTLEADFGGSVRFRGHESGGEYELDLTFTDLSVVVKDGKGTLRVGDVGLADLKLPGGGLTPDKDVLSLTDVPATLTDDGAEFFGGYYEAGQELDPVTVQLALTDGAQLPGPGAGGDADSGGPSFSSGALPTTGNSLTIIAAVAALLLAAGSVALWWSRRHRTTLAGA